MKTVDINGKELYQDHYLMKKNRLLKLQKTKSKCEVCGCKANHIHHKDWSVDNHELSNLIVLCHRCHRMLHGNSKANKTSKFTRLYGKTLQSLSDYHRIGSATLYQMHLRGELKDFLTKKETSL